MPSSEESVPIKVEQNAKGKKYVYYTSFCSQLRLGHPNVVPDYVIHSATSI